MQTMTPSHVRWEIFISRLGGPEGCDWAADETWRCSPDFRYARAILADMGGIDVDASLEWFKEHGAPCDCTILLNLDAEPTDTAA
jgi:hypothetical protein